MDTDSTTSPNLPAGPYYYGWNIVALALLTSLFSVGIIFYTHGIFRVHLVKDFGFTEGETFDVYSLYLLVGAFYSFAVTPRMIESLGSKITILIGCVVLAVGLFLMGWAPDKAVYYFAFAVLVSFGSNCMGMIASRSTITYWFEARRAQALSIAAMGITAGAIINVRLAQYLIDHFGWRTAYQVFAVIVLAVGGPFVLLFWKNRPQDIGLTGEPASYGKAPPSVVPDHVPPFSRKAIITNRVFLLLALSLGMASACWSIILQSLIADFLEQGYTAAQAANLFGFLGFVILIGKPLFGPIGDRIDRKWAILWTLVFQLVSLGLFLLSRYSHPFAFSWGEQSLDLAVIGALVFFGTGVGGCQPIYSAYQADLLGRQTFARAAGLTVPLVLGCQLLGYRINGAVLNATGTYVWMWYLMSGFYVVSILLCLFLPRGSELDQHTPVLAAELAPSALDSELITETERRRSAERKK